MQVDQRITLRLSLSLKPRNQAPGQPQWADAKALNVMTTTDEAKRDMVVEKYGAIEGGKQHQANLLKP